MRLLLIVSCLLCGLFMLLVSVVRAGAASDEQLREFLRPPSDCSAPCWMGIRPHETSADEAEVILSGHPWVVSINRTPSHISWRWNGAQPAYINPHSQGLIYLNGSRVATIRIALTASFGDVWTLFHAPDTALLIRPVSRSTAYQIASFENAAVQVISSLSCPARPEVYWGGSTTLHVGEVLFTEAMNGSPYNVFAEPGWWRWLSRCRRMTGL